MELPAVISDIIPRARDVWYSNVSLWKKKNGGKKYTYIRKDRPKRREEILDKIFLHYIIITVAFQGEKEILSWIFNL